MAELLDTEADVPGVTSGPLQSLFRAVAVTSKAVGGELDPNADDLAVTAGWGHAGKDGVTMPGKGHIVQREYDKPERAAIAETAADHGLSVDQALSLLGPTTCDVYLNDSAYWKNIPANVWEYTIGGYQVIKKWLSYREQELLGRALRVEEAREVMNIARRLAAIVLLQPELDDNYRKVKDADIRLAWRTRLERAVFITPLSVLLESSFHVKHHHSTGCNSPGRKNSSFTFPGRSTGTTPTGFLRCAEHQKEMVNYRPHPFYDRNTCQTFLAYRGGEVCGRIAAILNQGHNVHYDERRGFFGFFDCIDDQEAANGLFDAVRQWFDDQDIHRLRGPTNPSLNYELGLLIDGFDSPPTFMMTYNPPYYERLFENYGFRKTQDLYAFWGHIDMLPQIGAKLRPIAEQIIERYNVKLRPLDRSRFQQDVEMFLDLYNRSLVSTWGFVPMSAGELKQLAGELKQIIVPELTICAEVDGRMVGAAFGLPDYNPRIKDIDGRLFPFGFIHLLRNRRAIKRIRMISTNVLPEYQRFGIGMVLMHGLVPKVMEWGIEEAEFSWVLESNRLSYGALKKGGAKITKTYRLYDLDEDEGAGDGEGRGGGAGLDECAQRFARDGPTLNLPRARAQPVSAFRLSSFLLLVLLRSSGSA